MLTVECFVSTRCIRMCDTTCRKALDDHVLLNMDRASLCDRPAMKVQCLFLALKDGRDFERKMGERHENT